MSDEVIGAGVPVSEEVPSSAAPTTDAEPIEAGTVAGESADDSASSEDPQGEHEDKKKQGGFQRRIAKLSQRATAAEQEAQYWREQALRTATPKADEAPATASGDDPEPDPAKFDDLAGYIKAQAKWEARALLRSEKAQQAAAQKQAETKTVQEQFLDRVQTARAKYEDYDEVVSDPSLVITAPMAEALMTSDLGADVAYFLGSNPEEAKRIAALSPAAAAREIGRLEARIAPPQTPATPKAPPVTQAPPPPTPVTRTSGVKIVDLNDPNVNYAEWKKAREAQLAKRNK